ncbi:hypothetical protein Y695_01923 [Hydrogenophaga sp. T4]|nr:hypothetical protein Y695_01923 [Hydrogenophaga sp. T4]
MKSTTPVTTMPWSAWYLAMAARTVEWLTGSFMVSVVR